MRFSFYQGGIKVVVPTRTMTIDELAELVRGESYRSAVETLRSSEDKKERNRLKGRLDNVTPAGIFDPKRDVENCIERSGLLVLDFDDVENLQETKLQIADDPHVRLVFTSPSGNGLKVFVRIETVHRHIDYFNDLSFYFQQYYNLKPDASGSDISRVCYLSYDPELSENKDSVLWTYRGLKPPKEKTKSLVSTKSERSTNAKTVKHIRAIVDRVVLHQIDITGDYSSEWLLIAFSFASLGEEGRELFHKVSQFNPAYTEADADEKFSNALRTTRFTTPGKFITICKDYGIDVSVPKEEPAQEKPAEPTQEAEIVTDPKERKRIELEKKAAQRALEEEQYATVKYDDDRYVIKVKTGKYFDVVAEDFLLFIKYKTEDENEEITWILELRRQDKDSIFLEVPHEDFCSARKLKNLIAAKRLSLKITDSHLDELRSYLFRKTEFSAAVKVLRHGYHVPSGVYFFSNVAIVDGKPIQPDEFGIVPAGDEYLSIPQGSKSKQARYQLTDFDMTFNRFFETFARAHRYENVFIPACFYIFSLFRDHALKHKNFSPILFLKGGAGTGKSSIVRVLTAAFGRKQDGINLKSKSTEVSLIKLMGQSSNMMIWFDEYHNELGATEGLLQAAYDNDGYHRSSDNTSIETNAVEIHSALALTSNYLPDNPIFFSRCLLIPITSQEKTEDQREAFSVLEEWQEAGLGAMTVELLNHRTALVTNSNYATAYDQLYSAFKKKFQGDKLPERFFGNMAQIMAAPLVLQTLGVIQMLEFESEDPKEILEAFVETGAENIRRQHRIHSEKSELAAFIEILQTLYDTGVLQEEIHFRFNGPDLMLWFPQLYNLYAPRYRQIYMKPPADRDTIQTELAAAVGKTEWSEIAKSIRFRNDGEGNGVGQSLPRRDSCSIDYELLSEKFGLDFKSRMARK